MEESHEQGRRLAFGRFVKRARDQWLERNPKNGVRGFAKYAGISVATLYRWIDGDWTQDPDREKLDEFCRRLHIDPQAAYRILGWGVDAPKRPAPEPEGDPDVDLLLRKLRDPSVPDSEKIHMRAVIRYLANRPPPDGSSAQDAG